MAPSAIDKKRILVCFVSRVSASNARDQTTAGMEFHGTMSQFPQTLAIRNRTKVQWVDRTDSIKRKDRSMHSDRTLDRTRSVANENDSCPLRLRLIYLSSVA
jgi:hypothetical protein